MLADALKSSGIPCEFRNMRREETHVLYTVSDPAKTPKIIRATIVNLTPQTVAMACAYIRDHA